MSQNKSVSFSKNHRCTKSFCISCLPTQFKASVNTYFKKHLAWSGNRHFSYMLGNTEFCPHSVHAFCQPFVFRGWQPSALNMCKWLLSLEILSTHCSHLRSKNRYGNKNINHSVLPQCLNVWSIPFNRKNLKYSRHHLRIQSLSFSNSRSFDWVISLSSCYALSFWKFLTLFKDQVDKILKVLIKEYLYKSFGIARYCLL